MQMFLSSFQNPIDTAYRLYFWKCMLTSVQNKMYVFKMFITAVKSFRVVSTSWSSKACDNPSSGVLKEFKRSWSLGYNNVVVFFLKILILVNLSPHLPYINSHPMLWKFMLSLEPLISLDLVGTKFHVSGLGSILIIVCITFSQPILWDIPKSFVAAQKF